MTLDHCEDPRPARAPSGVARKREDYERTEYVSIDLTKMDDGRWLVTFSRYVRSHLGDLVAEPEPVEFISDPPAYLPSDVDVDVWLAADLASNVVLHQTSLGHSPVKGGRGIQPGAKYV
ncbi:hypothetical protein EBB56_21740 [Halomonas sp. YLB-10]|uniref:hypothetical protein n=1 Tax=Halomonas sp. YLB-10 TaxID=2483111 RepID=UPI000F5F0239|nr:hypothetical protein [Halomonas sp. YLB-10]RQW68637.1 hypothetical protein EBB56_21740 [Halomonas sp. YLB-10]